MQMLLETVHDSRYCDKAAWCITITVDLYHKSQKEINFYKYKNIKYKYQAPLYQGTVLRQLWRNYWTVRC